MATHFSLPETVFIIPDKNQYLLRFFATKGELPLCCHGDLGAVYYLFKSDYVKSFNIKCYQTETNLDIACIDKTSIKANLHCAVASIGSPKPIPDANLGRPSKIYISVTIDKIQIQGEAYFS